ncbi:ankyrin repeat-containing domain protein [Chytridium lagenaria]|nr:ankyrin repeat-containing domain protein [Chytridium lagenaria]
MPLASKPKKAQSKSTDKKRAAKSTSASYETISVPVPQRRLVSSSRAASATSMGSTSSHIAPAVSGSNRSIRQSSSSLSNGLKSRRQSGGINPPKAPQDKSRSNSTINNDNPKSRAGSVPRRPSSGNTFLRRSSSALVPGQKGRKGSLSMKSLNMVLTEEPPPEPPPKLLSSLEDHLMKACSTGDIDLVYSCIWDNVDVNCRLPFYGTSPLSVSFRHGHQNISSVLLSFGASLDGDEYGATPVHWAANNGQADLIRRMAVEGNIKHDDLQKRDLFGSTPLHFASVNNLHTTVSTLIDVGSNPLITNNDGRRPSDLTTEDAIKQLLIDAEASHIKAIAAANNNARSRISTVNNASAETRKSTNTKEGRSQRGGSKTSGSRGSSAKTARTSSAGSHRQKKSYKHEPPSLPQGRPHKTQAVTEVDAPYRETPVSKTKTSRRNDTTSWMYN